MSQTSYLSDAHTSTRGYGVEAPKKQSNSPASGKNGETMAPAEETSGLAFIEMRSDNPYDLFKEWQKEACTYSTGLPHALCLATVTKDCKVSARHVVLRRLEEDGFVVYTDKRSRKSKELAEVPSAAMCFLWSYRDDSNQQIARQVRVEGKVTVLGQDYIQDIYEKDKLFAKIRAYICHQDQEVDWNELKAQHDNLLHEVLQNKKKLEMPDHFIGYKLLPTCIEFYYAKDNFIGDRILFERNEATNEWTNKRIAA